jgi:glutaredoxin-like protein NrdH
MTKKELDRLGIKYESYDLTEHPDKLEEFKAKGLLQAPIVETDIKIWSGFRIDKIKSLHSFLLGGNHK